MALQEIPLFNASSLPNATGDVFIASEQLFGPANPDPSQVIVFAQGSAKRGITMSFRVPPNYVGAPKVIVPWKSSSTAANATLVMDVDYRAEAAGESGNQATNQGNVEASQDDSTTPWIWMELSLTLTAGDFAPGDNVTLTLSRDQSDATTVDDLAADVIVRNPVFQYADA